MLGRNGTTTLSLSDMAAQAGVSRPTLYRYFADKRELLDAFVTWERHIYEGAIAPDDLSMVARVRDNAGWRPSGESRSAVAESQTGHIRAQLGTVDERTGDLRLDEDPVQRRFTPYMERFLR